MRKNDVPATTIPEVMAFEEARSNLEQFKNTHPGLIKELQALAADYNQKLEAADKAVRGKKVSCGPWEYYQDQTKYNAKALYDALGDRQLFLSVGGEIQTVTEYGLDRTRLEIAIASNQVKPEAVEACKTVSARYHSPDPLDVP